jgi:hypothetical protein
MATINSTVPSEKFFPVTPNDSTELEFTRAVMVATAGNLAVRRIDNTEVVLAVPAGVIPIRVRRVLSTGTTAQGISVLI